MERIDVFALARQGSSWKGSIPVAELPRLAAGLVRAQGAIAYHCTSSIDAQRRPALRIALDGRLALRCDRCGGEMEFALQTERDFYFVAGEDELAAIGVDESPDEPLLGSAQFDLAGLIEDEAILQLPISPRHAHCTAEFAGALSEPEPHPFAGLAALVGRGKSGGQ